MSVSGSSDRPWTADDLDVLRALDSGGLDLPTIAERLGRGERDVAERLQLIHASRRSPSIGPDEEGDVPIPRGGRVDDPAAWVHIDPGHGTREG